MRVRVPESAADDSGSILPLIIFFTMMGLVVVLLVMAATSLYLAKKQLFTMADGAALVGAESFELDAVALAGGEVRPVLDDAAVAASVDAYMDALPESPVEDVRVDEAHTPDGVSAEVTLSGVWRPPVVSLFVPEGVPVSATATARSVFD